MSVYGAGSIGTDANLLNFNDRTSYPVYRVASRAPQRPQIREFDIPIPFENGISDFRTLTGKYGYVINGTMYPRGQSEYDSGLVALRNIASLELEQNDVLSDGGYVPYVWTEFERQKQVFLKALYVSVPEDLRGYARNFTFFCKIKDPTIYGVALREANTSAAAPSTATGTAIYPFSYPIVYGASTYSVTASANNIGTLPTYPVAVTVVGPVNVPRITNGATGEYIEVDVNLASASNTLSIAYTKGSLVVTLDGVSVLNQVSSGSTFFKIQPGDNPITLTGSSISDGAYASVTFMDAWPLS